MMRKRTANTRLLALARTLAWLGAFSAHAAAAQSVLLPQSVVKSLPSYCGASTLNGGVFMQLIHTIITHGDLTDVGFLEEKMNARFNLGYGWKRDGTHDSQALLYQTSNVLGAPIHATLFVRTSKAEQMKYGVIAYILFDSGLSPKTKFIRDCLKISTSDVYSSYGNEFLVGLATGGGWEAGGTQEQGSPGENGSKLYLSFSYVTKDNLVETMSVVERP